MTTLRLRCSDKLVNHVIKFSINVSAQFWRFSQKFMIWILKLTNKLTPFVAPVVNVKRLVALLSCVMNMKICFMFSV